MSAPTDEADVPTPSETVIGDGTIRTPHLDAAAISAPEGRAPDARMPMGGEVIETETQVPTDEDLPDMTGTLIEEMRAGYHRYLANADLEDDQAEKYEKQAPLNRAEAREYRAKAKSMAALMAALGYDVEDRTVSPEHPQGIGA